MMMMLIIIMLIIIIMLMIIIIMLMIIIKIRGVTTKKWIASKKEDKFYPSKANAYSRHNLKS